MEAQRCQGTNATGEPCSARPVLADGYCYWHSPARAAERAENNRKGGQARSNKARTRKAYITGDLSLLEVRGLLSVALKDVLNGDCEPGRAQAAASVARAIASITEVADIEVRLAALEAAATTRGIA